MGASVSLEYFGSAASAPHIATQALPLYLSADPNAPVVSRLVAGARFERGQQEQGRIRIYLPEIEAASDTKAFFISVEDFTRCDPLSFEDVKRALRL